MKISQSFTVGQPRSVVWDLFQDVPAVAECLPGARLVEDLGDGAYKGEVSIKLGPFTATFEGEAKYDAKPDDFSGHVHGKGIDRRGGSRSSMTMDYRIGEVAAGSEVTVDANVQLSGPIAQFGRTGIVQETAGLLIEQFVGNIEKRLSSTPVTGGAEPPDARRSPPVSEPPQGLNALTLLRLLVTRYVRKLFGRAA